MQHLFIIAVIFSGAVYGAPVLSQNQTNEEIKPWEKNTPPELRNAERERPAGAIQFESTCVAADGRTFEKKQKGYEECLAERLQNARKNSPNEPKKQ